MSMLAEPRRKQKISSDPRNLHWANDSSRFGQKLMETMGWTAGAGLGRHEQGSKDAIPVQVKSDKLGVGFDEEKDVGCEQIAVFDQILSDLNGAAAAAAAATASGRDEHSRKRLDLTAKFKQSTTRI